MRPAVSCIAALLALAGPVGAHAAAEITMEHTSTDDKKTEAQTISISPDGMRMETGRHTMIFRAASGAILVLDNEKHSYMDLSDMAQKMSAAQTQMESAMKGMPEAQRKQMEGMMAKMGGPQGNDAGPTYEKAGSSTVGSWSCQLFHVTMSSDMKADDCIAKASDVGLSADDLATFKKFGETMRNSMPAAFRGREAPMDLDAMTKAIGFEGVPVDSTIYMDGKTMGHTVMKSVAHDPIPAGSLDVPAGYTKQQMGDMMGHGGGGASE